MRTRHNEATMLSRDFPGAPYGDCCRTCNDSVPYTPDGVLIWANRGGRFSYVCHKGHTWSCGFNSDPVWNAVLLQRDRRRFRVLGQALPDDDGGSKRRLLRRGTQKLVAEAYHSLAEAAHLLSLKQSASSPSLEAVNAALDALEPVMAELVHRRADAEHQQ